MKISEEMTRVAKCTFNSVSRIQLSSWRCHCV